MELDGDVDNIYASNVFNLAFVELRKRLKYYYLAIRIQL